MSEMIERVAKTIKDERFKHIHKPLNQVYNELAKAAIEAMREPTERMLLASENDVDYITQTPDERLKARYRAMINEALK